MRILVLAPQPFFQNRGTPIAVRMIAEELRDAGNQVDVLVFHEGENVDLGTIVLHRTPALPFIKNIQPGFSVKKLLCDLLMLVKALKLCSKNRYDLVHAVEEAVYIGLLLKGIYRIPYVYDIDSWLSDQLIEKYPWMRFFKKIFFFCERIAVSKCHAAVAVCRALEDKVKDIDTEKPVLRLEDVSMLSENSESHESLADVAGAGNKIVLYVGNLEKYQGVDLLLESFRLLLKRCNDVRLVIIGGHEESVEKYTSVAEELAIDGRVFFIGPRPLANLAMYLQQADVLVSPRSKGVNTPMKIYSYMASGRPVVATLIESHTQVLNNNNAILAPPEPTHFAEALHKAVSDSETAERLAREARLIAEEHYSRAAFQRKLRDFYSRL